MTMRKTLSITLLFHAGFLFSHAFRTGHVGLNTGRFAVAPPSLRKTESVVDQWRLFGANSRVNRLPSSLRMASEETTSEPAEGQQERRSFIQNVAQSIAISSVAVASASTSASAEINDASPKITHKVFFDVRISRADGSFYVRDASPSDDPTDEPFYAQLVLGLFGEETPNHVQRFLSYVDVPYDVDTPLPSYGRSKFPTLDTSTGLLVGGTIPGLDVTTLAGGNVLEYSGRVLPAKLWLEDKSTPNSGLSHGVKGLLTHRNLDLTPSFGITTRTTSNSLDATHTIFGCILEDSGFLQKVVDLPVLTDTGRVSRTTNETGGSVGGALASSVFTAQRAVFRDAAKTFGDSRLEKVYDGKILRRIEVTKVGVL